jgi:hypothetical protein
MDRPMAIFRWIFPAGIAIAALGFGALLQACDSAAPRSKTGTEIIMTRSIPKTTRPPIDATAPKLAEASKAREEARIKSGILTKIVPAGPFTRAEGYHQKYRLRQERDLVRELSAIYPKEIDFTDSTAAARINRYLDGYGTLDKLKEELPDFGLSPQAVKMLTTEVSRRKGRTGCRL